MKYEIPGFKEVEIKYIVLDYNGTIARGGEVIEGVREYLKELKKDFEIFIITADTNGSVKRNMGDEVKIHILSSKNHTQEKADFVKSLGNSIAIGNGNNDELMLKEADLSICVIEEEGASVKALLSSDIVVKDIFDAFELILNPKRMIATLRR
ncbi:HAD family hydrolase [Caminibacter sp.]